MTATNRAERYRVPVAFAEAEVSLDHFSVEEIIGYLKHIGELQLLAATLEKLEP